MGDRHFERLSRGLYRFVDSCNVYVVKRDTRALLIDLGTGEVLEHLADIGIETVDWVLQTHHHRDQCQGAGRLRAHTDAQLAVPEREVSFFSDAETLWRLQQIHSLYDCANLFDRPIQDIRVDRPLRDYEKFKWRDLEFLALPTPGHTRGSLSYLSVIDGLHWGFSGDLIHSEGRVWTVHDLHWDYSNPDGLESAMHSCHVLDRRQLDRLAPSHGEVISSPSPALRVLKDNLLELHGFVGSRFIGDLAPPMGVQSQMREISPHLIEVTQSSANFYVLRDDAGHGLLFDYGFPDYSHVYGAGSRFVEHSLDELAERFDVRSFEVFIPTHYHDDHVAGAGFLKDNLGTEIWAFDQIADVLAHPDAYRLPASWGRPTQPDVVFTDEDVLEWRGHQLQVRHCPGHTRYAVALFAEIDGRRIVVSGDEIQLDGQGRFRGGGPVYRNGFRSDDFSIGVRAIMDWQPDVLLTGHDGALEVTSEDLEGVLEWSRGLERSFTSLAANPDELEFAIDPAPVSVIPYHSRGQPGQGTSIQVAVSNHADTTRRAELRPFLPDGWISEPESAGVDVPAGETSTLDFTLIPGIETPPGRSVFAIEASLGERRMGQAAEGLMTLKPDNDRSPTSGIGR